MDEITRAYAALGDAYGRAAAAQALDTVGQGRSIGTGSWDALVAAQEQTAAAAECLDLYCRIPSAAMADAVKLHFEEARLEALVDLLVRAGQAQFVTLEPGWVYPVIAGERRTDLLRADPKAR